MKQMLKRLLSRPPFNRYIQWRLRPGSKCIALTFDDGPHPQHTHEVLDLLEESSVKATFFVLGCNVERQSDLTVRILEAGHELGIHGYHHTIDNAYEEISHSKALLENYALSPTLYRPPHGKLSFAVLRAVLRHHLKVVMWSLDTRDSFRARTGEMYGEAFYSNVSERDIVLMHDDVDVCVKELPLLLSTIRGKRLRCDVVR